MQILSLHISLSLDASTASATAAQGALRSQNQSMASQSARQQPEAPAMSATSQQQGRQPHAGAQDATIMAAGPQATHFGTQRQGQQGQHPSMQGQGDQQQQQPSPQRQSPGQEPSAQPAAQHGGAQKEECVGCLRDPPLGVRDGPPGGTTIITGWRNSPPTYSALGLRSDIHYDNNPREFATVTRSTDSYTPPRDAVKSSAASSQRPWVSPSAQAPYFPGETAAASSASAPPAAPEAETYMKPTPTASRSDTASAASTLRRVTQDQGSHAVSGSLT